MSSSMSSDEARVARALAPRVVEVPAPASDLAGLVGHTPLIELGRVCDDGGALVLVKHEGFNPGGSVRDRTVLEILDTAAAGGLLRLGDEVVVAGATNSALSMTVLGQARGYRVTVFHSKKGPRRLLHLLDRGGARVKLVDADDPREAAAAYAREKANRVFLDPTRREALKDAIKHIAREVVEALDGQALGAFVATVSTGSTLRHTADELHRQYPRLRVVGVSLEVPPQRAGWYDDGAPSVSLRRAPEGDSSAERWTVTEAQAWKARALLALAEGLLLGPRGAAAALASLKVREEVEAAQAVVALSIDGGQRYFGAEPPELKEELAALARVDDPAQALRRLAQEVGPRA